MKVLFICIAGVFLFVGCGDTSYYPEVYPPTVSVTGIGTANGIADMATVNFNIDVSDADADIAVNTATTMAEEVTAAAVELGINENDIETIGYNLYLEEEYDYETYAYTGENIYHLTHSFAVTIRDISIIGDVLGGLVEAGATSVYGVNFSISNREELIAEAREEAILNAQETAQKLADGLNVNIGAPTNVSEWIDAYTAYSGYPAYYDEYSYDYPSVSPGNSSVTVNVSVSFEIE